MTIQESFQPRGKELEYRIVAVNKVGDGEPSNTDRNGCSVKLSERQRHREDVLRLWHFSCKTLNSKNLMIKRLFSSQLRINMFSGVAATIANSIVLAIAYPVYLHFLGYEKSA